MSDSIINKSTILVVSMLFLSLQVILSYAVLSIDHIVHGDLYSYGLQFNWQWASNYWIQIGIVWSQILSGTIVFILFVVYTFRINYVEYCTFCNKIMIPKKQKTNEDKTLIVCSNCNKVIGGEL